MTQDYRNGCFDSYGLAITQPTHDGCKVNRPVEPDPEFCPQKRAVRFEAKPHFHDVGRLDDVSQELMRAGHANLNNEGVFQGGKPTIDAREALAVLQEQMDVLHDMLHGVEYGDFRAKAWQLLPAVANHVLGLDDGKKRFADTVLAASKAFALCCTLDEALAHRDELAFLQAVKAALTKHVGTDKKLNDEQKEHALRQIMSRAIVSDEVIDIFTAAGLKSPDIGVLSDEFLEDVRHMKERNLAVELLERLLKGEISRASRPTSSRRPSSPFWRT